MLPPTTDPPATPEGSDVPAPDRSLETAVRIEVKPPAQCAREELAAFEALVSAGGEVRAEGLLERLRRSLWLAFAIQPGGELAGTAALKRPEAAYRDRIWHRAGFDLPPPEDCLELGWFHVLPAHRRRGLGHRLMQSLLPRAGRPVFATTRESHAFVRRSLEGYGFKLLGAPYGSERGDYRLALYLFSLGR
jgi:GNAT superfamily N-acetyltransferase